MNRPTRVRAADVRSIYQLVNECRELGDDPIGWRRHLAAGAGRLLGAGLVIVGEIGPCVRGPRRDLGTMDWGWENGFNRSAWLVMLGAFRRDPIYNPLMNAYIPRLAHEDGVSLTRADLIADREWDSLAEYREVHRAMGADATLFCFRSISNQEDEFAELIVVRGIGEPDFGSREKALSAEIQAEITPLIGRTLARFAEPSPADLSPRARQVLRCLLEGDGDKQVAARLGLSRHTVNQYCKLIFGRFGVSTRGELLARWVKRCWGDRPAWLDDPSTQTDA